MLTDSLEQLKGPIVVTGAAGFVGARLFNTISNHRSDVRAIVRDSGGWRLADVPEDQLVRCDLTDRDATERTVRELAPQTVFHCAAYGAYPFEQDVARIYDTNVTSLAEFINLLSAGPISAFVHAGTSSEYGTNCSGPSEDADCRPNSAYAASKLAAANHLRLVGAHQGFPCINLRLYAVYGPYEDTSRLVPTLVHEAMSGRLPRLVDENVTRDFIHVDDVCAAFIHAAARIDSVPYGSSFNIGTGRSTSIGEIVESTRRLFGVDARPRFGSLENRTWDLTDWYANPTRAHEDLGWRAEIGLADGLLTVADWMAQMPDGAFETSTKHDLDKPVEPSTRGVSAIVACYQDGEAIPQMYQRLTEVLNSLGTDHEIIFVNDGSPDDSEQIILDLSSRDTRVVGVNHSRNFGSQMAFRSGMEIASKDAVILLDGDLQDPPEIIREFHQLWLEGYEVVYGIRTKREMSWLRSFGHKAFYRLFRRFSYVNIPIDAGDFSLMDRRVVDWILESPERDLFMRGLRAYVGFRQTGVEYVRPKRVFGESTNDLGRNIGWAKRGIFSFSDAPLTMLTALGSVTFALSALAATAVAILRLLVPDIAPRGATTILIVTLLFGSFNLFAIGLVGEYVAKIMTEVKRRPRLIRSSIIRRGKMIPVRGPYHGQ